METAPHRPIEPPSPPAGAPRLLVFTLGARAESRRRRLLPAHHESSELDLRHACLATALAAGRANGCRLEVSSPAPPAGGPGTPKAADVAWRPQTGRGFGRRLAAAVAPRAGRESGPLVVVGTDTPGLGERHVRRALDALAADPARLVLGPSPDGGVYLIAAARPLAALLGGVAWCRRDTGRRLERAALAAGFSVVWLEPLADLDRPADLERWLARRGPASLAGDLWRRLAARLARLLDELRRPPSPARLGRTAPALVPAVRGRGPPAV